MAVACLQDARVDLRRALEADHGERILRPAAPREQSEGAPLPGEGLPEVVLEVPEGVGEADAEARRAEPRMEYREAVGAPSREAGRPPRSGARERSGLLHDACVIHTR